MPYLFLLKVGNAIILLRSCHIYLFWYIAHFKVLCLASNLSSPSFYSYLNYLMSIPDANEIYSEMKSIAHIVQGVCTFYLCNMGFSIPIDFCAKRR